MSAIRRAVRDFLSYARRAAGQAPVWLLAWLLLTEALLRATSSSVYGALIGPVSELAAIEHGADRLLATPPAAIFLGDSRMQSAVAPRIVEEALDLAPGATANLAMTSGTPADALAIYRHARHRLVPRTLVAFGANDWQFNALTARIDSGVEARFRARASLHDRAVYPVRADVPDLVLGYVWTWWDMRPTLQLAAGRLISFESPWAPPPRLDVLGRPGDVDEAANAAGYSPAERASQYLGDYRLWQYQLDALGELASSVTHDGNRFLVIRLPLSAAYNTTVDAAYPSQEAYWLSALHDALPGQPLLDLRDPRPWDLLDHRDFYDYGHFTSQGSARFSQRFAAWLSSGEAEPTG